MSNPLTATQEYVELWKNKVRGWTMHIDSFDTVDEVFVAMEKDAQDSTESPLEFSERWQNDIKAWSRNVHAAYVTDRFIGFMVEDAETFVPKSA